MTRLCNQAFDDQVLAALHDCDDQATCKELAIHLGDPHGVALYAPVYGSLCRMIKTGQVVRRRYQSSANVFWSPTAPHFDLSALEWAPSEGEQK